MNDEIDKPKLRRRLFVVMAVLYFVLACLTMWHSANILRGSRPGGLSSPGFGYFYLVLSIAFIAVSARFVWKLWRERR